MSTFGLLSAAEIQDWALEIEQFWGKLPTATRASELNLLGDQRSRFRGQGMDYEDSRLYQAGDELRHLNWRLMARTGKAFTKLFVEERQAQVVIFVDLRASMRFATQGALKATQALKFAGFLAWLAQNQAVKLQMFGYSEQLISSPILTGKNIYSKVMQQFALPLAPGFAGLSDSPSYAGSQIPSLQQIISQLQSQISAGAQLWILSDFADISVDNQAWLQMLNHNYQLNLAWFYDAAERSLPTENSLQMLSGGDVWQLNSAELEAYNLWAQQDFVQRQNWLQASGGKLLQLSSTAGLQDFGSWQ